MDALFNKAQQALTTYFGYQSFKENQKQAIQSALAQKDTLVIMPTGAGKSLCYQIPALVLDGVVLVVSPLIALMKDQVDQLTILGIPAAVLNSTQSYLEQQAILSSYRQKQIKLLYVAPESLNKSSLQAVLQQMPPSLIAIDEAHCISQWGHSFRKHYLELGTLKIQFPNVPMMALTATADELTQKDILKQLRLNDCVMIISSFDRENINYSVIDRVENGYRQIDTFLKEHIGESGIIYCLSRKRCEQLGEYLKTRGYQAEIYHAGLDPSLRVKAQERFLNNEAVIMVATIAFGMGINKSNVRFVIHANAPKSIENYYQETGRAGRDGLPAQALLLYRDSDLEWQKKQLEEKETSFHTQVEYHKINTMKEFVEAIFCRRIILLNYFDEHLTKPCGNCDICLNPPKYYDGLEDAQKLLSAIARTGQIHSLSYLIDLLRGDRTKKIIEQKSDQLQLFGLGKHHSKLVWESIARQLIQRGYIKEDILNHKRLYFTESSRSLLTGQTPLQLVQMRKEKVSFGYKKEKISARLSFEENLLLANLKHKRMQLSKEYGFVPDQIFNDAILQDMVQKLPITESQLLKISGVGILQAQKYGAPFLDAILKFKQA